MMAIENTFQRIFNYYFIIFLKSRVYILAFVSFPLSIFFASAADILIYLPVSL